MLKLYVSGNRNTHDALVLVLNLFVSCLSRRNVLSTNYNYMHAIKGRVQRDSGSHSYRLDAYIHWAYYNTPVAYGEGHCVCTEQCQVFRVISPELLLLLPLVIKLNALCIL